MIRIGDSDVQSLAMITPQSKVVETRRFLRWATQWEEISKKCIAEKKFLILTPSIGYDGKVEYYPGEQEWRGIIEDSIQALLSYGGNLLNCRIDIINETIRYCKDNQRATNYINWAYSQARGRIKIGAGCDELVYRDYYNYICTHANFDVLVIHIQSACDTEQKTRDNVSFAKNLANQKGIPLDCNEAGWKDVKTLSGHQFLIKQMQIAEEYGCANFCNVFNDLDRKAFNEDTKSWDFLCYKINGVLRSPYFGEWTGLMEGKAPVPNIPEERTQDGMILSATKLNSTGYLAQWVEEVLIILGYDVVKVDGIFSSSDVVWLSKFQSDMKNKYPDLPIVIDGVCGRQGYFYLNDEIADSILRDKYWRKLNCYASPVK